MGWSSPQISTLVMELVVGQTLAARLSTVKDTQLLNCGHALKMMLQGCGPGYPWGPQYSRASPEVNGGELWWLLILRTFSAFFDLSLFACVRFAPTIG